MNVQHFEKGLSYTDKDLMLFARKIGKLATYCKRLKAEDSFIRVESERLPTKKDRDQVHVMLTVSLPKSVLRAESRKARGGEALDRAIEKLLPQIERYKEMHMGKQLARRERRKKRQ